MHTITFKKREYRIVNFLFKPLLSLSHISHLLSTPKNRWYFFLQTVFSLISSAGAYQVLLCCIPLSLLFVKLICFLECFLKLLMNESNQCHSKSNKANLLKFITNISKTNSFSQKAWSVFFITIQNI